MELKGFVRSDNRAGFRNYVAVIPLSGCLQEVAFRIAAKVDGVVALTQPLGCDLDGQDQEFLGQTLYQIATHQNVGAVIFLTMSCAATNAHRLPAKVKKSRPVRVLNMHHFGGTTATVEAGVEAAAALAEELQKQQRQSVPLSAIILGTKCGASDKTSYQTCHPVMGAACDRLVELGSTVVLSENFELICAVEDFAARAVDNETARRIRTMKVNLEGRYKKRFGRDLVFSDLEKARLDSLASASKAGTKPIRKVVDLGQIIDAVGGLVILDGPNTDIVSVTSMMAAGCNLLLFSTGLGTPVNAPLVPTIKITANPKTYEKMSENIDLMVSESDKGNPSCIVEAVIGHANGKPTKGEIAGHAEMFVPINGVTF